MIVDFKDLIISGSGTKVFGKGIVSTNQTDDFKYGYLVQIECKLVKPANFVSTSTPSFDYVSYLEKDNILYEISFANVTFVSAGHGNPIKSFLFLIKNLNL